MHDIVDIAILRLGLEVRKTKKKMNALPSCLIILYLPPDMLVKCQCCKPYIFNIK